MVANAKPLTCPVGLVGMALAIWMGGCAPDARRIRLELESIDPAGRIRAVSQAVELGDRSLVSALVDRLDDEDVAVRMYAILGLEKLVGTRLGYSYRAPRHVRQARIEDWRRFVQDQSVPATPDTGNEAPEALAGIDDDGTLQDTGG